MSEITSTRKLGHYYGWNIFRKSFSFSFRVPNCFRKILRLGSSKYSFGFWVSSTVDQYVPPPPPRPPPVNHNMMLKDRQFRLLTILPGTKSDSLMVQLCHVRLEDNVKYEAFSYVWEHETRTESISIIQEQSEMEYQVRPSLHKALRGLRLEHSERVMWIYALCVNQDDICERNSQVAMMDDIFKKAQEVVIWLGGDTEGTSLGMKLLRHFVDPARTESQSPIFYTRSLRQMVAPFPDSITKSGNSTDAQEETFCQEVRDSIQKVLTNVWFQRVWTASEVIMSQKATIHCGQNKISWTNDFHELQRIKIRIKAAVVSPQWNHTFAGAEIDLKTFLDIIEMQIRESALQNNMPTPEKNLLDIMYDFRYRNATDPRDKIYAMLGLAQSRRDQVSIVKNYEQSAEEIYQQLNKALEDLYGDVGFEDGI